MSHLTAPFLADCLAGGRFGALTVPAERACNETDPEEARQIARAQNHDPSGIDWLLSRYRARVIRLAAHILRRPDEAEDVAQEAFVKAFRNIRSYRNDGAFYTWLYQIVVRVCIDRRNQGYWRIEEPILDQEPEASQSYTTFEDLETRIVVEQLMDRLSPAFRATLVLRELEGMEYTEIAKVLGIPVGLVRWRLHTARKQFQKLWERGNLHG